MLVLLFSFGCKKDAANTNTAAEKPTAAAEACSSLGVTSIR